MIPTPDAYDGYYDSNASDYLEEYGYIPLRRPYIRHKREAKPKRGKKPMSYITACKSPKMQRFCFSDVSSKEKTAELHRRKSSNLLQRRPCPLQRTGRLSVEKAGASDCPKTGRPLPVLRSGCENGDERRR
ncbi:hypothetical protein CEXT_393211 [Caerostris extrusa]|uniref:Uncharacterized protein n=1 Tax=Caerostris extrusa TaxID=172846 RepID=A0AAV4VPL1_CAEEX|nr:hypothetical protein CEXT_393211 [Caerostris extrusa]